MQKVLCIGPGGRPLTGQSIAFDEFFERSRVATHKISNNFEGMHAFAKIRASLMFLAAYCRMLFVIRPSHLYVSIKRSSLGAIMDAFSIALFKAQGGKRTILHVHGADIRSKSSSWLQRVSINFSMSTADRIIILVDDMKEALNPSFRDKATAVGNFSSQELEFSALTAKIQGSDVGPLHVLYLSNIIYSKGITFLTEAVEMLADQGANIKLTIAGAVMDDKDWPNESVKNTTFLGCQSIDYIGVVEGVKKWELLQASHIIALPTFYAAEAQPLSLIEGMAYGCVPLTTRHNFNQSFLPSEPAVIYVKPQSTGDIFDKLSDIIQNRDILKGRMLKSAKFAHGRYGADQYALKIDREIQG